HNDASLLHFVPLQALLSFPTRRSSDLGGRGLFGKPPGGEDAARERPGGGGRPGRTEARRGDRHRRRGRRDPGGPRGRADGAAAGGGEPGVPHVPRMARRDALGGDGACCSFSGFATSLWRGTSRSSSAPASTCSPAKRGPASPSAWTPWLRSWVGAPGGAT